MAPVQSITTTQSGFEALLDAAVSKYKKRTGQDLRDHPLAAIIDRCQSLDAILAIFQEQSRAFDEFRNGDPKLIKWLTPVVNGLYAISTSTVISTAASLVSAYPLLRDRYSMVNSNVYLRHSLHSLSSLELASCFLCVSLSSQPL
jgi:hypothetical protein